jgi:hypothetical protein
MRLKKRPVPFAAMSALVVAAGLITLRLKANHVKSVRAAPSCLTPGNANVAPPVGFSPVNASSSQLRCYGFPAKPTDPEGLKAWTHVMTHALDYVPPTTAPVPGIHFPTEKKSKST